MKIYDSDTRPQEYESLSHYFYHVFPYITPVVYPVGMIAQTGSVYLTMCVTVERYVAVCLPLKVLWKDRYTAENRGNFWSYILENPTLKTSYK